MIWKHKPDLDYINQFSKNTLVSHLGIEVTEIGDDFLRSEMPVDERTRQPMGLLHGGASVVLSESIGSLGAYFTIDEPEKCSVVGIEISASHVKSAKSGKVYGITRPVKLGKTIQIWQTNIFNEADELICSSKLTVMVLRQKE
ncbi:MAG: hotdog fold thioesterase [Saprospiraceae bacterium]|nr:hotdog fold thioesterase [Saprospiraceae bacterium]